MNEIKTQAECFRIALEADICSVPEAIAWCDSIIAESEPDINLIEASLEGSRGRYAVAEKLRKVVGVADEPAVHRQLFRMMRDKLSSDREMALRVAKCLMHIERDYDVGEFIDPRSGNPFWLYDYFDVSEGIPEDYFGPDSPVDDFVIAKMLEFLDRESLD